MSNTGITITTRKVNGATRIEVESQKLKTIKNARFRHPLDDFMYGVFDGLATIYNN